MTRIARGIRRRVTLRITRPIILCIMIMSPGLLLLTFTGCDLVPLRGNTDAERTHSGGGGLSIVEEEIVGLDNGGPLLSFEEVTGDSRCPSDAACVWAGEAAAAFRLTGNQGDTTFVLTIPGLVSTPYEQNDAVLVLGFEFTLLELSPYPRLDREDPPPNRALLHIEKYED
jgi:hypothetical protein